MIFKRIAAKSKRTSERSRIERLIRYISNPESSRSPDADGSEFKIEKCTYFRAVNYFCDTSDIPGLCQETADLADQKHVNASCVINHYLLSFDKFYVPSNDEIDFSVKTLMTTFEMLECQHVYGRHDDTDNIHVHILVNRVNPSTYQAHRINGGFDIRAGHQARMLIEEALCLTPAPKSSSPAFTPIELATGFEQWDRTITSIVKPILDITKSWEYLHLCLNEQGMTLIRSGNGLVITLGSYLVRASKIDQRLSKNNLELKLGPYQPPYIIRNVQVNLEEFSRPIQLIKDDKLRMAVFSVYLRDRAKFLYLKSILPGSVAKSIDNEMRSFKAQINAKLKKLSEEQWENEEEIAAKLREKLEKFKVERQQFWQKEIENAPTGDYLNFDKWCELKNIDFNKFYQLSDTKNHQWQLLKLRLDCMGSTPLDEIIEGYSGVSGNEIDCLPDNGTGQFPNAIQSSTLSNNR